MTNDRSALATSNKPDIRRIERIVTLIEHVWKIRPDWSFRTVFEHSLGKASVDMTDEEIESALRDYLRTIFSRTRDDT